jgi:hypothetical protein
MGNALIQLVPSITFSLILVGVLLIAARFVGFSARRALLGFIPLFAVIALLIVSPV